VADGIGDSRLRVANSHTNRCRRYEMSVHVREPFSQRLLDDLKSAVELSAIFETASSTVGSQITVTFQPSYATNFLIAKFKFGEMEVAHAISERMIFDCYTTASLKQEFCAVAKAFVADVLETLSQLPFEILVISLWEEAGIAIGGEW